MNRRALSLLLAAAVSCGQETQKSSGRPQPAENPKMTKSQHTNRLANEKSPYLLQHAHNPVDWYPWGEEAFARARKEDKPIFLSIGYSTCHWCHVMERESFENEQIANILNENFVCIKVDREERPDVDQVYMAAVQAMTGSGGWPLSIWLTPDRQPFVGGTYFPPEDRWQRPGFPKLLKKITDLWKTNRIALLQDAKKLTEAIAESSTAPGEKGELTDKLLQRTYDQFEKMYDPEWGGFGGAPKFPRSITLEFLLRRHARTGEKKALEMVEKTLVKMAEGGMYDQLGGGFHRYSTDGQWLVPHFEKMLYDNALLVRAYVQAWQITRNPGCERVARETIEYVLRDMLAPEGAFYSAEDADSDGVEGKFYVWNPKQIKEVLGDKEGQIFCEAFGVTTDGNWEPQEESIPHGNSCLRVVPEAVKFARQHGVTEEEWRRIVAEGKKKLFTVRSKRVRPHRDDKILTEWNALMIGALAFAGAALDEPRYLAAAERAAGFVLTKMRRADGRLLRRYREGEASIPAYLDDYAFLSDALVDLYHATFKVEHAETAVKLVEDMIRLFGDKDGGFWFTASDNEQLVARMKELYDGALPSGNSVALHALVRIAELASRDDFKKTAEASFRALASQAERYPAGYPHFLSAFDMFQGPFREIVIAGDSPEMLRAIRASYLPNAVVVHVPAAGADPRTRKALPNAEAKTAVDGKAAAYVCENFACKLPVTTAQELEKILAARR